MGLTAHQVELGAMFLAASNTGLVRTLPTDERGIKQLYQDISYDYEQELGEGLDEEREEFAKAIYSGKFLESLRRTVPFILETASGDNVR